MLKLIDQLSSGKDLVEEEETTPELSGESNSNSQEGFIKTGCEEKSSVEGPSEVKKFKPDEESSDEPNEPIISEAIESPVLMVKGEGNGADCDMGNPGEDKPERICQDETKEDKNTGAAEKSGDNTETISSNKAVENPPVQLQNSSPIRDNWKETPPLIDKNEKSHSPIVSSDTSGVLQIESKNSLSEPEDQKSSSDDTNSLQVDGQNNQATSCNNVTSNPKSIEDAEVEKPVDTIRTDLPVDDQVIPSIAIKVSHDISAEKKSSITEQVSSDGDGTDLNKPLVLAQSLNLVNPNYGDSESNTSNEEERDVKECEDLEVTRTIKVMNSEEAKTEEPGKETVKNEAEKAQEEATIGEINIKEDDSSPSKEIKIGDLEVDTSSHDPEGTTREVASKGETPMEQETAEHPIQEKHEKLLAGDSIEGSVRLQENATNIPEKMLEVTEKSQTIAGDAEEIDKVESVEENDSGSTDKVEPVESFSFIPLSKENRLTKTTLSFGKPQSEQMDIEDDIKADNLSTNSKSENESKDGPCIDFEVKEPVTDNSQCSKDLKDSHLNSNQDSKIAESSHNDCDSNEVTSSSLSKINSVTNIDSTSDREPTSPSIQIATPIKSNEKPSIKLEVKESMTEPISELGTAETSKLELEEQSTEFKTSPKSIGIDEPTQPEAKASTMEPVSHLEVTEPSKPEHKDSRTESPTAVRSKEVGKSSTYLEAEASTKRPVSEPGITECPKLELKDQQIEPATAVTISKIEISSGEREVKESATDLDCEAGATKSSQSELKDSVTESAISVQFNEIEKASELRTVESSKLELTEPPTPCATSFKSNEIDKSSTQLGVEVSTTELISEPGTIEPSKLELMDQSVEPTTLTKSNEICNSSAQRGESESTVEPAKESGTTESSELEPMDQSSEPTTPVKSNVIENSSTQSEGSMMDPLKEPQTTGSSELEIKDSLMQTSTSFNSNKDEKSSQDLKVEACIKESLIKPGKTESSQMEVEDQSIESATPVKSVETASTSTQLEVKGSTIEPVTKSETTKLSKLESVDESIESTTSVKSVELEVTSTQLEVKGSLMEPINDPGTTESSQRKLVDQSVESTASAKSIETENSSTPLEVKGSTKDPVEESRTTESSKLELKDPLVQSPTAFKSNEGDSSIRPEVKECLKEPLDQPGATESSKLELGTNEPGSAEKQSEKPSVPQSETESKPCEALEDSVSVKSEKSITTEVEGIVPIVSDSKVNDAIDSAELRISHETAPTSPCKEEDSVKSPSQSSQKDASNPELNVLDEKNEDVLKSVATCEADEKESPVEPPKETSGNSFPMFFFEVLGHN